MPHYSRGQLAKRCAVNIETVRYYENLGLLKQPARSAGGHRIYNDQHLSNLRFIKRCRELGFTLNEVRSLRDLVNTEHYTCAQIRDLTAAHLDDVQQKIKDLKKMEKALKAMILRCDNQSNAECPVVEELFQ